MKPTFTRNRLTLYKYTLFPCGLATAFCSDFMVLLFVDDGEECRPEAWARSGWASDSALRRGVRSTPIAGGPKAGKLPPARMRSDAVRRAGGLRISPGLPSLVAFAYGDFGCG
jgi:hypothetical protein